MRLDTALERRRRGKYARQPTVVFGGASTVGQMAIQLLKLSGFSPIIATASAHNFDYLRTLGATHILDRNLTPEALQEEIRKITDQPFQTIFDAAGVPETQLLGYDLLASGGTLAAVRPDAIAPEKNRTLGAGLYAKLTQFLAEGTLKPSPVEVLPGRLEAIAAGLQRIPKGLSCLKLVARPQET
ncbi:NAD(P)-binding protein [Fomitopsis betulina]|nr:NAD(P)-binding protein [Fomitopsis betulina]